MAIALGDLPTRVDSALGDLPEDRPSLRAAPCAAVQGVRATIVRYAMLVRSQSSNPKQMAVLI